MSAFQPGVDGNCIAIAYIRETNPRWVMVPCDKRVSIDLICKHQPRAHNPQRPVYPSLRCQEACLLIDDTCYEYKLSLSTGLGNDNVGCAEWKPYISYLNKNFANHGINVIFTIGCSVISEFETDIQVRMSFQNDSVNYLSTNVKALELRKSDTGLSICGSTTQRCHDGSCRSQSIVCTLDFECAPNVCACMVDNRMSYNKEYCRHHCPPGICTCAPLMFQCSIGGCIPYLHVCDNENNCADSSDEFCVVHSLEEYHLRNPSPDFRILSAKLFQLCFDFICTSGKCIDIHFVNDLIPDCSDASDEYHSLSIKYDGSYFHCRDAHEIPCIPGHSKCFEIRNFCVYDHDNFGHTSYCRDGTHLQNCIFMKCTNSFKCTRSYCIPLRKVCDGVHDCIDGEDEINCQNNICPGYLKCNGVEFCIHPTEVCDGYSHCPHGDDEELCDTRHCPIGCACLWRSISCRYTPMTYMPEVPFQELTYLSVRLNNKFDLIFSNLSSLSRLIILDLSSSTIANICPMLQQNYQFYKTIHALYLQRNDMEYISSFCFSKLSSLIAINLKGNHLIDIANDAFKGMSLDVLILENAFLSSLSDQWIGGFYCLNTLDKRGMALNYWSQTVVNSLEKIETVFTDDARLCCILANIKGCHDPTMKYVKCFRLLSKQIVGPLLVFPAFANLIAIMITMKCVQKLFSINRPLQYFLHNVILVNKSLCVIYVLAIATIDMYIGKHYIFWYSLLSSKLVCQVLSTTLTIGIVMYNLTVTFRDHIAYMAVSRMFFNEIDIYSKAKKFLFMSYLLVITGFVLFTIMFYDKHHSQLTAYQLCTSLLWVSIYNYKRAAFGPVLVCSIILVSLIYSIFTYCAIYKVTYSSSKRVQTTASRKTVIHQPRLSKLMEHLSQSALFRSLECFSILSTAIANMCGMRISLDIQVMSILFSTICGSFINEMKAVWYPILAKK